MKERIRSWTFLAASSLLCAQWLLLWAVKLALPFPADILLPGLGVLGAAFMLTWAAELAQMEVSKGLAIALLALITVLPEYTVDIYLAWTAGKNPVYTPLATANMTGANRLLIGAGWAAVGVFYWLKSGKKEISIAKNHRVEIFALLLATLYSFIIPIKGNIALYDSAVLVAIYAVYVYKTSKAGLTEPELEGGPAELFSETPRNRRLLVNLFMFALSGLTIFLAAKPFAEGLISGGEKLGIEKFLLIQWVAPLASEAPEFIVAIIFALKMKGSEGLGILVSSKVNQWTLLVGMLPIAFSLSAGSLAPMHMDARQVEELLLTSAQSLFALIVLANLRFSLIEALTLFVLFVTQFFFTNPSFRLAYSGVYILLAIIVIIVSKQNRTGLKELFTASWSGKG